MKNRKNIIKKCVAMLCIGVIAMLLMSSDLHANAKISAEDRYSGSGTILQIMSRYIYFVEGNLTGTTTAHTSGSIVVGGDLNYPASGFGNIIVAPSYIGHICGLNYINSMFPGTEGYQGERVVYYGTVEPGIPEYLFYKPEIGNGGESLLFPNAEYMSVSTIMSCLRSESVKMANNGSHVAYKYENGILTIDFDKSQSVTISEDVAGLKRIELNNITIERLMKESHIISFETTGVVNLNAHNIFVDGTSIDQKFMNYAIKNDSGSASTGGQYYLKGLNLVWNMPYATSVNAVNLNGQLVAPKAMVTLTGGRHEGCVIASSVYSDSEAHFYPLGILISKDESTTEGTTTEEITETTTTEETTTEATTTEETTTETATTETNTTTEAMTTEETTTGTATTETNTTTEAMTTETTTTEATTTETTTTTEATTSEEAGTTSTSRESSDPTCASDRVVQTDDGAPIVWLGGLILISLSGGALLIWKRK